MSKSTRINEKTFPICDISNDPEIATLKEKDRSTITFLFTEKINKFEVADIIVTGGEINGLTCIDGKKWTAQFKRKGEEEATIKVRTTEVPSPAIKPDPVDSTNFPDGVFRKHIQDLMKSKSYKTLIEIKELNISNLLIEDLTGIELLIGLKQLRIYGCSITAVDLSKNVLLSSLEIQGNYIKTIDLSKLLELTKLTLNQMELETIDLSALTSLKYLQISSNNLQAIDISKITSLEVINLLDNRIKKFTLNDGEQLKYLNLNKNLIEELKLPELKALIRLDLEHNKFKEISFDFTKLKSVEPRFKDDPNKIEMQVPNFTDLRELNISHNQLTKIDLTKYEKLVYLNASSNRLEEINLEKQTQLKWLDLSSNKLTKLVPNDFEPLKHLDLSHNQFKLLDFALPEGLTYLDIGDNNLSILRAIGITSLKTLKLYDNPFKTIEFSKELKNLSSLSLKSTHITELALDTLPNLENLDIRLTKLEHVDFKENPKLTSVLTSDNKLISINLH